jgi:hypothetical protein
VVQICALHKSYIVCTDVFSKVLTTVFARGVIYSTIVIRCKIFCSNCGYRQRGDIRRGFTLILCEGHSHSRSVKRVYFSN